MLDSPEPPKSLLQKLQERAAASRFFTVSLLLHMGIIIIGGSVVLFKQMAEPEDFTAGSGLVGDTAAAAAPPEQQPDVQQQLTPQAPSLNTPSLTAITSMAAAPTFTVASAAPVSISVPADAMAKVSATAGTKGLAGLPGTMAGRAGGTARGQAMAKNGGKKEGELAVLRGLRWLVKTQNSDGSWSTPPQFQAAMTGFALLSFLGHGETPVSPEFGPTVGRAIDWVLENGKKHNGHLSMEPAITQHGSYAHGIVTYALGEYYTMTKDDRAAELFKQAVKYIVDGQGPDGGWMYNYDKSQSDTSVTGWQIQALKAAHLSGLSIEGVDAALDKAMLNLKRVQGPNGGFGYRKPEEERYSLTGVGVLCTYFWKQNLDKSVASGVNYMFAQLDKNPVEYKDPKADLYTWYYNTQACLMVGDKAWTKWNALFQDQIIKSQAAEGFWPPMVAKSHADLQVDEKGAGPYYRTNLCILMLEVYYRYTPSLK